MNIIEGSRGRVPADLQKVPHDVTFNTDASTKIEYSLLQVTDHLNPQSS